MVTFIRSTLLLLLVGTIVDGFVQNTRTGSTTRIHNGMTRELVLNAQSSSEDDQEEPGMDRRKALKATSMAMLSLWLGDTLGSKSLPSQWAAFAAQEASEDAPPRTILITGCNSGIGLEAARILARRNPRDKLVLACRTQAKAEGASRTILEETPGANLVAAECDLASLASIQSFAKTLEGSTLDVVCYNAGIALNTGGSIEKTADGFEKTIGTNHLGHFYLHHLLQSKLGTKGRIVVTASSVHDPESPGGKQGVPASLGDLEGFARDGKNFEMVDGNPYNGDKAYKDSKLCNIFFTKELQRRLANSEQIVNAFSPGLITSTGFFRYQNPLFSSVFDLAASSLFKVAETPQFGGATLAYMTTVSDTSGKFFDSPPGTSYKYINDGNDYAGAMGKEFTPSPVSKEAMDAEKGKKLWALSEQLVGISS